MIFVKFKVDGLLFLFKNEVLIKQLLFFVSCLECKNLTACNIQGIIFVKFSKIVDNDKTPVYLKVGLCDFFENHR